MSKQQIKIIEEHMYLLYDIIHDNQFSDEVHEYYEGKFLECGDLLSIFGFTYDVYDDKIKIRRKSK